MGVAETPVLDPGGGDVIGSPAPQLLNMDSPTHKSAMTTPWDHVGPQHLQPGEVMDPFSSSTVNITKIVKQ